jgi:hypothetical protein
MARRLLYHPDYVARIIRAMKDDLHRVTWEMRRDAAATMRELNLLRDEVHDLRRLREIVVARRRAEHELADLRRQREMLETWRTAQRRKPRRRAA